MMAPLSARLNKKKPLGSGRYERRCAIWARPPPPPPPPPLSRRPPFLGLRAFLLPALYDIFSFKVTKNEKKKLGANGCGV